MEEPSADPQHRARTRHAPAKPQPPRPAWASEAPAPPKPEPPGRPGCATEADVRSPGAPAGPAGGAPAPAPPVPVVAPRGHGPVPAVAYSGAGRGAESGHDDVIVTRRLSKRYRGRRLVVDSLDLAVPRGSVFGFLGPNGSGKTTTIRMLMGLVAPTSGSARVLGRPMPYAAQEVLPDVGALIEGPALYGFLSGRDNLARFDAAEPTADPRTRAARVTAALERVGLAAAAGRKTRTYSLGMKQRLGLGAALLRSRRLLVLDEPTNGLDPQGMREIRLLIRELAADGTTVFLSSHLLDEIEQVCTHAAVMAEGRLLVQGTVDELSTRHGRLAVTTPDPADALRVLREHGVLDLTLTDGRITGELPTAQSPDPADLNAALVRAGVRVRDFGVDRVSLEDAFVALTGEGFDVAG